MTALLAVAFVYAVSLTAGLGAAAAATMLVAALVRGHRRRPAR